MARPSQRSHFHMKLRSDGRGSDGDSSNNSDDDTYQEAESIAKKTIYPNLPKGDVLHSHGLYPHLPKGNQADEKDSLYGGVRSRMNKGGGDGLVFESKGKGDFDTHGRRGPHHADVSSNLPCGLKVWHICCGVCLLLFLGVLAYMFMNGSNARTVPEEAPEPYSEFKSGLKALSTRFPTQTKKTWSTIVAASNQVLTESDPEDPMILLLAAPQGAGSLATCLAREVALAFSTARGASLHRNFYLDGKQINATAKDQFEQKRILDDGLKEVFETGGHSVVLDNLQALSGNAASMLHPYCDNGNASYRKVQLVFVVHLDDSTSTGQGDVEAFLERLWSKDIRKVFVGALMVRIANNLVQLVPEPGFDASQCQA